MGILKYFGILLVPACPFPGTVALKVCGYFEPQIQNGMSLVGTHVAQSHRELPPFEATRFFVPLAVSASIRLCCAVWLEG